MYANLDVSMATTFCQPCFSKFAFVSISKIGLNSIFTYGIIIIIIIIIIINNNLLLTTKLAIKTYLQLISLKKKKTVRSKHYLQVSSFHRLLFISIKKNSIQLKKFT